MEPKVIQSLVLQALIEPVGVLVRTNDPVALRAYILTEYNKLKPVGLDPLKVILPANLEEGNLLIVHESESPSTEPEPAAEPPLLPTDLF
jgi:hypothetical protein